MITQRPAPSSLMASESPLRVLLTGASGFVAEHILEQLLDAGYILSCPYNAERVISTEGLQVLGTCYC